METNSVITYFGFGTGMRYLQDAKEGAAIHGDSHILRNIERFLNSLDELNLQVTLRASYELDEIKTELESTPKDARLTSSQAKKLSAVMKGIRKTLEAELLGFDVYVVTPKRIDVKRLLSNVSELFAPGVCEKLPEVARYDLSEAGKCIAYECPTAAAFHLMRATESVLRAFYCQLVQRNRIQSMMWGAVVQDLRSKRKFKGHEAYSTLFANLDNIRVSFRNPTQHPDKIYDTQEVQDLWGLCVDVINRMAKDLPEPEVEIPF